MLIYALNEGTYFSVWTTLKQRVEFRASPRNQKIIPLVKVSLTKTNYNAPGNFGSGTTLSYNNAWMKSEHFLRISSSERYSSTLTRSTFTEATHR